MSVVLDPRQTEDETIRRYGDGPFAQEVVQVEPGVLRVTVSTVCGPLRYLHLLSGHGLT